MVLCEADVISVAPCDLHILASWISSLHFSACGCDGPARFCRYSRLKLATVRRFAVPPPHADKQSDIKLRLPR